jgi:23S rRNA (cytidine1920-2'-O)/16S rRNA (cytidine1409-2'-O)-methyltransferase
VSARRRLDAELVRRGLSPSRERAQADIAAGRVTVGGAPATKAARLVGPGEALRVHGPPPRWVSRAGAKLEGAIQRFALASSVAGARVLDCGASTGGFTDCLLQHGAAEVVAIDVGHNQLHERLRSDPRVRNVERTNLRTLDPSVVGEPVDLVVGDLSFISLRMVLGPVFTVARAGAPYAFLVKPQFEAGRSEVAKGRGVVTDPVVWRRVLEEVGTALLGQGATIMGAMVSPITGSDGNVEFVVVGRAPRHHGPSEPLAGRPALQGADLVAAFDAVVVEAAPASTAAADEHDGGPTTTGADG